jgi:hypothetical protein
MRPSNKQRSRNKPGNNGHNQRRNIGNIINRVFESAGPDGKVRGTPQQIIDKYQALARDAQVSGDRVTAESFLQHAEHYSRLLGEAQRQQMENRFAGQQDREDGQRGGGEGSEPQRQQAAEAPVASGLTTIDPEDSFDTGGPVDTPEGRRQPVEAPAPEPANAPALAANGRDLPMAAEPVYGEGQQPAKRQRPRRRPRAEAPENPAQAE